MGGPENKKLDKCVGAILGAAAGDALGWPYEQNSKNISKATPKDKEMFKKWIRRDGGRFWSHEEEINPGEYSDDTQLIIATARSLRYGSNWSKYFSKVELPAWLSYERGGGGATKRAAEAWKRGNNPWSVEKEKKAAVEKYFNAGGNGVAMRILPHVFNNENSFDEIMHQVVLNGIFTHGHPRALIGATVYADALIYLLNNEKTLGYGELVEYLLNRKDNWSKFPKLQKMDSWLNVANEILKNKYMALWDDVAEEVMNLLKIVKEGLDQGALDMGNDVLERLGCFDRKINGAGTVTAVAAIYLASKYASSPRLALTEAAYLKNADTDTLASMVGGLLGILHGADFLSVSWLDVQDYEYLKKLIHLKPMEYETMKAPLFDYQNPEFKAKLKQLKPGDKLTALPFGQLVLKDKKLNKANAKGIIVNTLKFVSEEGQNVFIKTFERGTEEKRVTPMQERIGQQPANQQAMRQQQAQINKAPVENPNKLILNARKISGLVNTLPEHLSSDLSFLFVGDVMAELERNGTGTIDQKGLNYLKEKWSKHRIDIKNIEKVVKVILYY